MNADATEESCQWQFEIFVDAPVDQVWEAVEDLSLIPRFHPEVSEVEMLSGTDRRAPGVRYRCIIPRGRRKGWCIEEVVENIPRQKMSVAFPDDSWGLSQLFTNFRTDLLLQPHREGTILRMRAYYRPVGLRMRIINFLVLRWLMPRRARKVLIGFKRLIEDG